MNLTEITLPYQKRRINLLTIFLGLSFFGLIFYFRTALGDLSTPFTFTFLGIIALSVIFGKLETFILLLLILTATVFELPEFPTVPIQIGDLYFSDLLIIILLLGRLLKRVTVDVTIIPKPMGYPVLAILLVGIFSFVYAVVGFHVSTASAGIELRAIIYFSLFFLVCYYIRNQRQLRSLLLGIALLACIVTVLQLIQWIIGPETNFLQCRLETLATARIKFAGVARVILPGKSIVLFTLNTLIAIYILKALKRPGRSLLIPAIALLTLGLIMTFGRIHWIMVMAGTLLLLILARRRLIIYPRITFLIVGASLVLTLILQLNVLNPAAIRDAIFKRTVSIVRAPSNFKEDTLYMRYLESRFAWQRIIEHPLLGIGLGNTYRPLVFGNVDYERFIRGTNVHNGYLATQLKMGILGTLAYSWLVLAFFYRFLHKWKRIEDPLYQTVALGVAMSVGGMLIANLTASPFLTVFWVSVTAVGMGVVEKIYQFEGIT